MHKEQRLPLGAKTIHLKTNKEIGKVVRQPQGAEFAPQPERI